MTTRNVTMALMMATAFFLTACGQKAEEPKKPAAVPAPPLAPAAGTPAPAAPAPGTAAPEAPAPGTPAPASSAPAPAGK